MNQQTSGEGLRVSAELKGMLSSNSEIDEMLVQELSVTGEGRAASVCIALQTEEKRRTNPRLSSRHGDSNALTLLRS